MKGGYLDEIDRFDYSFFGLAPKTAKFMDPNQRLFLQSAWHAIEDAGYAGDTISGSQLGVYVGYSKVGYDYERLLSANYPEELHHYIVGNLPSVLASRIAYFLNLKGPAVTVDTACSSSLVAVHMACKALLTGDCEMALAGVFELRYYRCVSVSIWNLLTGSRKRSARIRTEQALAKAWQQSC